MEIKKKQNQKSAGFSLIEILVVIGVLAIAVVIGTNLFFTTFRSSTKTKTLTMVKQNGDYALSVMERLIRDSEEVIANTETPSKTCELGMNKIKVKRIDGSEIEFECLDEGIATGYIASTSAVRRARLISEEVKLDSCSFDCSQKDLNPFNPQSVVINFTLSQAGEVVRFEEQASVDFQTAVTTRNY